MQARGEDVPWDVLSVGATRPPVIRTFGVPFWFILPILAVPLLLMTATGNPFWMGLIVPLTAVGRLLVARDHNRPRVLLLAALSGSLFGDRTRWGGVTIDPLGSRSHGL